MKPKPVKSLQIQNYNYLFIEKVLDNSYYPMQYYIKPNRKTYVRSKFNPKYSSSYHPIDSSLPCLVYCLALSGFDVACVNNVADAGLML